MWYLEDVKIENKYASTKSDCSTQTLVIASTVNTRVLVIIRDIFNRFMSFVDNSQTYSQSTYTISMHQFNFIRTRVVYIIAKIHIVLLLIRKYIQFEYEHST